MWYNFCGQTERSAVGSASAWGVEGRWFKSSRSDQKKEGGAVK